MSRIIAHGQTHSHAWTDDLVCSSSGVHVSMELQRWYFYYQHLDDFMVDLNRENKPKKTLEDAAALTSPAHLVVTGKKRPETQFRALSVPAPSSSSPSFSVTGVLTVGAVAHVVRVELHLDGDAVETKLGVEQIGGLLQHKLSVGALCWCGMRQQKAKVSLFIGFNASSLFDISA